MVNLIWVQLHHRLGFHLFQVKKLIALLISLKLYSNDRFIQLRYLAITLRNHESKGYSPRVAGARGLVAPWHCLGLAKKEAKRARTVLGLLAGILT